MPAIMDVKVNDPLLQNATKRLVADGRTVKNLGKPLTCSGSTFEILVIDTAQEDQGDVVRELGLSQPSPLVDVKFTKANGKTKEFGRASSMPYKTQTNVQPGIAARAALMSTPYEQLQLAEELDFATVAQTTANMGGTMPASAVWTNVGTNIRFDLIDAKEAFPKQCRGKAPNAVLIPPGAWSSIQKNTAFIEQYKYEAGARMTRDGLELTMLENLELIIPGRVYNTAQQGLTVATDYVWQYTAATVAVVCYIEKSGAEERMGWIRQVQNTAYGPGGEIADNWFDKKTKTYFYDYRSDKAFYVQTKEYALGITGIHA